MTPTARPLRPAHRLRSAARGAFAALALGLALPAAAQAIDPADVTFWQSIQSSENPEEYKAYLAAFPAGTFAELARLRIQKLAAGGEGAQTQEIVVGGKDAAAQDAPAPGGVLSDAVLTVTPENPRVGDEIKVLFADMPNSSTYDIAVIVAAGSPEATGTKNTEGVLRSTYTSSPYYIDNGWTVGQLSPGSYEVRWLTTLYNNESRLEIGARTAFDVSR